MDRDDELAAGFEAHREHLRGVAYRMLGSLDAADDALQRAWLRAEQAGVDGIDNLGGWLTTVTARVCLDMLRARRRDPVPGSVLATGGATPVGGSTGAVGTRRTAAPEDEAVMAESVGLALLVVLNRLSPAQRVAFVLHDLFAVPFDEVAVVVDRSVAAAKKLASRARERVRGVSTVESPAPAEHRAVVAAFLAAAQGGDLGRLLELLAPDVVRRADSRALPAGTATEVRIARAVADETRLFAARARVSALLLVDGAPGIVVAPRGRLFAVLRVTVRAGRISALDVIAEPSRLGTLALTLPDDGGANMRSSVARTR